MKYLYFIVMFFSFTQIVFSQLIIRTREQVLSEMENYLESPHTITNNHTNKWQSNYYSGDNEGSLYHNTSTWIGKESMFTQGAPYAFGVKDTPTKIDEKIAAGVKVDITTLEADTFSIFLDSFDHVTFNLALTSTNYLPEGQRYITFEVESSLNLADYKIELEHVYYTINKNSGNIEFHWEEVYNSWWVEGDQTYLTYEIPYSGIYNLYFSSSYDTCSLEVVMKHPSWIDENVNACGAHVAEYKLCDQLNENKPDNWAFGIDCSGFVSYGYNEIMNESGTRYYYDNYEEISWGDLDIADCIVRTGSNGHIVMVATRDSADSEKIWVYESRGQIIDIHLPPDGTAKIERNIVRDYKNNGYVPRTPFVDNTPPKIENIYLCFEEDTSESELANKWTHWNTTPHGEKIRPNRKYDIIVDVYDEHPYMEINPEVKRIEYTYTIFRNDSIFEKSTTGFKSINELDNYGTVTASQRELIYGSGTDAYSFTPVYQYIITNDTSTTTDAAGTLDLTYCADSTKITIEVTAYDWRGNWGYDERTYWIFPTPPLYCDDIPPVINAIYLTEENDTTETKKTFTESDSTKNPIITPKGCYDIIADVCDYRPGSNWEWEKGEVFQIKYTIHDTIVNNEQEGFLANTLYNYESLLTDARNYIYAGGTDVNSGKYKYIITNNNSTTSDAGTWNIDTYHSTWRVLLDVNVTDWNKNPASQSKFYWIETEHPTDPFGVEDVEIPDHFLISQNYPNPFNSQTSILNELPEAGNITISIYNIQGQKVKTLMRGYKQAGFYKISWDGTNEHGTAVNSGVYFYTLLAKGYKETKKLILLR